MLQHRQKYMHKAVYYSTAYKSKTNTVTYRPILEGGETDHDMSVLWTISQL